MKSPAFQFYVRDWLGSRAVRLMTAEQRGFYIQLLAECWDSPKYLLPADGELLWKLAGAESKERFLELGGYVLEQFKRRGKWLYHSRLNLEREKQEMFRRRQTDNGRKGGRPGEWNGKSQNTNILTETHPKPMGFPDKTQTKPKPNPTETQTKPKPNPNKSSAFASAFASASATAVKPPLPPLPAKVRERNEQERREGLTRASKSKLRNYTTHPREAWEESDGGSGKAH